MGAPSKVHVFSSEGLERLARYVSKLLPKHITVTVMYEEFGIIDPEEYTSDFYSYDPQAESALALASVRNEKRIEGALAHMNCSPPWSFDTTKYPVLFFSIETVVNYYGFVGITLSEDLNLSVEDDDALVSRIFKYIQKRLPEPQEKDDQFVGIFYIYGSLTNPRICYDVPFYND